MLSQNLKRYRKRAGMTQKQVADKLHISPQAYARYERTDDKKNEPSADNLALIADMFDISIDELLGRESKPKDPSDDFDAFMFDDKEAFDALPEDVKQELIKEINDKIEFLAYKQKNKGK